MKIELRIKKILERGFQDLKEGYSYYERTLPKLVKLFERIKKTK